MATLAYGQVNCLTLNGSDNYVGNYGDILDVGLGDLSYQIWFKTTSSSGGIMGKSYYGSTSGRWSIQLSEANPGTLRIIFQGSTTHTLDAVNGPWNNGVWHNATVTCKRDGDMTLYMDGVYNNHISIASSQNTNMNSPGHFFLGVYGNSTGTGPQTGMYLNGSLCEARVWNRLLTAAEVAANYGVPISPTTNNLVGYWKMDEGQGNIAYDSVANGHNGTIYPTTFVPTWETDGPPTLPVELSSFTATISTHNNVVLTWVTQSETSVMGFYVYRGTDPNLANAQQITALIDATNTSDQQVYVYTDSEINQIGTYYYWLMVADINGSESFHGPIHVTYENTQPGIPNIPVFTELKQVYPNPFNPNTNISYVLAQPSDVLITIFNMRGQEVRSFDSKNVAAGSQKLTWDGKDQNGTSLASGVYYIRMQAGADSFFKKAVLMK
ncbi:MAG: T9SS type A sorting domain-containing protein [Candidatus Cloacimonetes bacterium]|nr:T9SS type A sorting domain-containing protein [Candidatus Cloacimonadota bacterium]